MRRGISRDNNPQSQCHVLLLVKLGRLDLASETKNVGLLQLGLVQDSTNLEMLRLKFVASLPTRVLMLKKDSLFWLSQFVATDGQIKQSERWTYVNGFPPASASAFVVALQQTTFLNKACMFSLLYLENV